ncbi:MAG: ABC-type transport auxiliary lipoprotein family protein [Halothiobacillaceae bacterium]
MTMRTIRLSGLLLAAALMPGCATIFDDPPDISTYRLVSAPLETSGTAPLNLRLKIQPVRAAAAFDTARMPYSRQPAELAYYTRSQWVAPVGDLLTEVLRDTFETSGTFALVTGPEPRSPGDVSLRVELGALLHEFVEGGSVARLSLRAVLLSLPAREPIAVIRLDLSEPVEQTDAAGFARAANRVVQRGAEQLVEEVRAKSRREVPEDRGEAPA